MRRGIIKNSLIKFKWEQGVYDQSDMVAFVELNQITPEEFKEITRLDYNVIRQKVKKGDTN